MRYVNLMGEQKPHLLFKTINNLGAETCVQYATSTKFYLQDRYDGKSWITRLPFPVHVVERVETYDHISRSRFVTRYAYHHGYFDGGEREFRGFGMVEQWDTEEYKSLSQSQEFPTGDNIEEASHIPPVLTKTWFHTGAYIEGSRISRLFEEDYYREGDESRGEKGLTDEQLQRYMDGELRDDTLVVRHLDSCPRCRQELEDYRHMYDGLREDTGFELSADFAALVMSQLPVAPAGIRRPGLLYPIFVFLAVAVSGAAAGYLIGFKAIYRFLTYCGGAVTGFAGKIAVSLEASAAGFGVSGGLVLFTALILLTYAVIDRILIRSRGRHFCL